MFLTWKEYLSLGIEEVIRHLLYRHLYYLSLKICSSLDISPDFILVQWAAEKIHHGSQLSDEALRDQLREQLKHYSSISYPSIASIAFSHGRTRLATMLLAFEPSPAKRVVKPDLYNIASLIARNGRTPACSANCQQ